MNDKFKIEDMGCDCIRGLDPNFGEYNIKVRNYLDSNRYTEVEEGRHATATAPHPDLRLFFKTELCKDSKLKDSGVVIKNNNGISIF